MGEETRQWSLGSSVLPHLYSGFKCSFSDYDNTNVVIDIILKKFLTFILDYIRIKEKELFFSM